MTEQKQTTNLLQTWDAYCRSYDNGNDEWIDKHWTNITETLLDKLPHGSGIDFDWRIYGTTNLKALVCSNSWHYINENGMYTKSWDFQVIIKADVRDMFGKIIFRIVGQFGKHQDIKDYLYETIAESLDEL